MTRDERINKILSAPADLQDPDYKELARQLAYCLASTQMIPQPRNWTIDQWCAFKQKRYAALVAARKAGLL